MTLIYPFRDFLAALREKDAELFAKLGMLRPSEFWQEWKKVYPEDFPNGGLSIPHRSSIVPRAPKPTMTLAEYDARRAAFVRHAS